jgi:hypothetical protein
MKKMCVPKSNEVPPQLHPTKSELLVNSAQPTAGIFADNLERPNLQEVGKYAFEALGKPFILLHTSPRTTATFNNQAAEDANTNHHVAISNDQARPDRITEDADTDHMRTISISRERR